MNKTLLDFTDAELINEIQQRHPELIVLPRVATHIMTLRGAQTEKVFFENDIASDWFDLRDVGEIKGFPSYAEDSSIDCDERTFLLSAAIYRGCIEGFEEWEKRKLSDGNTQFVASWNKPCILGKLKQ